MRSLASLAIAIALVLMAAGNATGQTGPWTDGEILVRSQVAGTGQPAIFRVVPETGATAVLTTTQYWGGWAGSMVFDSYRGGLLSNMSMAPDNPFLYRLWLVSHDGTSVAMPGFTGSVRAMASAGDGRVFFVRYTGSNQGLTNVEYFDANNVIQILLQSDGVTPFQADVEHLVYHAPSNALIGSSSAGWAASQCTPIGSGSLYRIPLSVDGLRVDSPVTCISVPTTMLYAGEIMGLDDLPNGNVLVTTASGWLGSPQDRLLSLNPVTLAIASWAVPQQYDVNGGIWSARLGKAIIHADSGSAWWEPNGLRTFSAGQTPEYGTHIPTSLPLPAGGGFSPHEYIAEVDLNGPACGGLQIPYGTGLAGFGNVVPTLAVVGCPDLNSNFTIAIDNVVGAASGALIAGVTPAAIPIAGGTLYVDPILIILPVTVNGVPATAGGGSFGIPLVLTDPALSGLSLFLQAGFIDSGAVQGVSFTNGLHLVIG